MPLSLAIERSVFKPSWAERSWGCAGDLLWTFSLPGCGAGLPLPESYRVGSRFMTKSLVKVWRNSGDLLAHPCCLPVLPMRRGRKSERLFGGCLF
jgi:hypothetical protein